MIKSIFHKYQFFKKILNPELSINDFKAKYSTIIKFITEN